MTTTTKAQQAEQAYNEAKAAAERRYCEAIHAATTLRGGSAVRDAARAAANEQLAADYQAAENLARQILTAPEPHWGQTEWAKNNVGLN